MTAEVEVLHPGLFSSIQDTGRFGYRKFGVPASGPMDTAAASLANLLLGQDPNAPVMEITQMGPKLKFHAPAQLVITGALLSPSIEQAEIKNNRIYNIKAGETLNFGRRKSGSRAYLGIKGGFKTEKILKSLSWSPGITPFSRLEKGMKLPFLSLIAPSSSNLSSVGDLEYLNSGLVEVFSGPEFDKLSAVQKKILQKEHFTVGRNSSRMGIQLEENLLNDLDPIITSPVLPGTVQLTPSGRLIVLMRDCQTTGGYPRILQLKESGLNTLAQKLPGEKIQFSLDSNLKVK